MFEFDDKKLGYTAIVYVMESTNSVIVHFDGFNNLKECNKFWMILALKLYSAIKIRLYINFF